MDLGRINPGDAGERFCMSTFACNTCQEDNGVSWCTEKYVRKCSLESGKVISQKKTT